MSQSIHTIDSRGHVMLEVMRDCFGLSAPDVRREITGIHKQTVEILSNKGIPYQELRSSLVPRADRHEAAFIFDSQCIDSSWYGLHCMESILPLLNHKSSHSVLCGDLIGEDQDFIYDLLDESLVLTRNFEFVHGTLLYCIYINNLSESFLKKISEELKTNAAYIGYISCTFSSRAKNYLSSILSNRFLKYKGKIIMGHEDDRPNGENDNVCGYPFEKYGYSCDSLQSSLFGVFLSYKIERSIYKGFEVDSDMAINAISNNVQSLKEFSVYIEEKKFGYLQTDKGGKLALAGLEDLSLEELSNLIKTKLMSNYLYNMAYLEEHDVSKFNIMLEIPRADGGYPTRVLVSLEYQAEEKKLRVLTLC